MKRVEMSKQARANKWNAGQIVNLKLMKLGNCIISASILAADPPDTIFGPIWSQINRQGNRLDKIPLESIESFEAMIGGYAS